MCVRLSSTETISYIYQWWDFEFLWNAVLLRIPLGSIPATVTELNMLQNSHTCNTSTRFSLIVFMSVSGCMCMRVLGERERERGTVFECGDSFRSNCVELDSTQECTKRLDFLCCIVSRTLIKSLTQYCIHESHVIVK